jgi:hypothetical protein
MGHSHYVIVGQPVWDVKMAEYMSTAGDVLTSASAWMYVNEAEYCTQPCGDGRHTKASFIFFCKHSRDHRLSINRPTKRWKEKSPFDGHCQYKKEMEDHLLAC